MLKLFRGKIDKQNFLSKVTPGKVHLKSAFLILLVDQRNFKYPQNLHRIHPVTYQINKDLKYQIPNAISYYENNKLDKCCSYFAQAEYSVANL